MKTQETKVATFTLNGKQIDIIAEESTSVCGAGDGSKPWMWGRKVNIITHRWFVDGVYTTTFGWSKKENIQNILKRQFIEMCL